MSSRANDPGFQRFLRQRQEDEAWAAYRAQHSASVVTSSTPALPSTPVSNNTAPSTHAQTAQEANTVHAPEPIRPAQVTQPYHSARALPPPQNQALVAPSAYAPFIGAATLAPSAMTLSTSHVNQARLASARTTLPRRITQRNAGRPLGSTNRRGPSIAAPPGPRVDSCFAPGLNGDRVLRLTIQVYPPAEGHNFIPVVYQALGPDWSNLLRKSGLLFDYELPAATTVQEVLQHVICDLRRNQYSFPPIHHYGDTTGAPISHIQLLSLVNKGKANLHGQVRLEPVVKPAHYTIEHLTLDRNHFAAPELCIALSAVAPEHFIIRFILKVSPLYRQDGTVKHSCISTVVYGQFPRDGGSVGSPKSDECECEEGEWDGDWAEEQITEQMLLGVGTSTSSTSTSTTSTTAASTTAVASTSFSTLDPFSITPLPSAYDPTFRPVAPLSQAVLEQLPQASPTPTRPRLTLRSLPPSSPPPYSPPATATTTVTPTVAPTRPSLPAEIWSENAVFTSEHSDNAGLLDIETFTGGVYAAATGGSDSLILRIRGSNVEDAGDKFLELIDTCLDAGDCERLLVKDMRRHYSLDYPNLASGPGVEREVLFAAYTKALEAVSLLQREDGFSTLRLLFASPEIPVPESHLRAWPAPLDPCIFQFFIHDANLHALHPTFIGEWHPSLRNRLNDFLDLGPEDDLTPFASDFATYLDTEPSAFRNRDLQTHLAIPPVLLAMVTLGTSHLNHPVWGAFQEGFLLKCPSTGFTFPQIARLFLQGSEAFLSVLATSYISSPDILLANVQWVGPADMAIWDAALRNLTGRPDDSCKARVMAFVNGSGIPCPEAFEAVRHTFHPILDLTRMDTPGYRGQIIAWGAGGSPFVDVTDKIEIGPISCLDATYAQEINRVYGSFGTVCFRSCGRSMRYPIEHLFTLARASYGDPSEPASLQEAIDYWLLVECLQIIGRYSMP
ncbi:hypothetical protein K438DRAFT_1999370 [Mycena galopus ATCC 62051]|nr:hypothetical protein K438DRAFT_1999370 [Mycena galopus ATCC 62051]